MRLRGRGTDRAPIPEWILDPAAPEDEDGRAWIAWAEQNGYGKLEILRARYAAHRGRVQGDRGASA